jgi:hypothetical protein
MGHQRSVRRIAEPVHANLTEMHVAATSAAIQTQVHSRRVVDRLPSACRQVIAFEFGRDVMERLRGAHPAVSAVMEIMLTDIGAESSLAVCFAFPKNTVSARLNPASGSCVW